MKKAILLLGLLLPFSVHAQISVDFEQPGLPPDTVIIDTLLHFNQVEFYSYFDNSMGWDYWEGFALSNYSDSTTAGYSNQYSSWAGSGANGSENYLVHYYTGGVKLPGKGSISFYVNNTTYAGLDMKFGSGFSKKFGGLSGDDPDFFILHAVSWIDRVATDTNNIYLADFRSNNNSEDFILRDWKEVHIPFADSISFFYTSSDTGAFGINTPQYFCLDNLSFNYLSTHTWQKPSISLYPNPCREFLHIEGAQNGSFSIRDIQGKLHLGGKISNQHTVLNLAHLQSGIYFITFTQGNIQYHEKIIKH